MKRVIPARGLGTRLAEATVPIPMPMVEFGGKSILGHAMNIHGAYGNTVAGILDVTQRIFAANRFRLTKE